MIELQDNRLVFQFPKVHPEAGFSIEFQRTLRIPDDNREHSLPPGFGGFPLHHVDDFAGKVPGHWVEHGGVFLPMYQAEAMWMNFEGSDFFGEGYPFAVKVAAGKIDALTGKAWKNKLTKKPQDYLVVPEQPWLDGFCVKKGQIRQFVAMPLGQDYTAEEQLTGKAEHGGIQIIAYPMKREVYEAMMKDRMHSPLDVVYCKSAPQMGLAPGGLMRQEIYKDPYGIDVWDTENYSRCFVHIANSEVYQSITGNRPPMPPPTAKDYTDAGLPWFDYYDESLSEIEGAEKLAGLDSVAAKGVKKGEKPLPENEPVEEPNVKVLKPRTKVREGKF
jgi:hypothetical protein